MMNKQEQDDFNELCAYSVPEGIKLKYMIELIHQLENINSSIKGEK